MPGAGNIKNPSWYVGQGGAGAMWPGAGNVYYLNGCSGSNTNSGLTPSAPKLTMTAALALCTNDNDDYIIVQDYWQPAGETWPVNINKSKVHIIGVKSGGYRCWACMAAPADTACLSIAADDVRIANLYFDAGASHGGIEFAGSKNRMGIYDCWFGTGKHGIYSAMGGIGFGVEIAGCFFCQALTAQSIYIADDPAFFRVHDNVFDACQGVAIEVTMGGGGQIYDNMIACGADVQGRGITLGASVYRCLVMDNKAYFGNAAGMAQNPFLDSAAAGANHWANNMWGITLTHPA